MLKYQGLVITLFLIAGPVKAAEIEDCDKYGVVGQLEDRLKCLQRNERTLQEEFEASNKADSGQWEIADDQVSGHAPFHFTFVSIPVVTAAGICQVVDDNKALPKDPFDCRAIASNVTASGFDVKFEDKIGPGQLQPGRHSHRTVNWIAVAP